MPPVDPADAASLAAQRAAARSALQQRRVDPPGVGADNVVDCVYCLESVAEPVSPEVFLWPCLHIEHRVHTSCILDTWAQHGPRRCPYCRAAWQATDTLRLAEAAQAKKENSLPEDYRESILNPFFDEVAQLVDRSFQMFFASGRVSQHIDQLLIAGGSAYLEGIVEHLGQRLQIPAERARPLSGMKVALRSRSANLERNESALLLALGLASRTFDPVR